MPYINEGQSIQPLKVIAITTDGKKPLAEGTLAVVNNQVDSTSGTIRLKAVFDNKNHALWPGQSASTRLLVKTLKDATVVPDDAIQHSTDGLYAYIVNQDNKAELRKVKVSQSIDGRSVVDEGLSPGQQVITGGQFKVQPDTPRLSVARAPFRLHLLDTPVGHLHADNGNVAHVGGTLVNRSGPSDRDSEFVLM